MEIQFESSPDTFVPVDLDSELLDIISTALEFPQLVQSALRIECRVPDVWRYTVQVSDSGRTVVLKPNTRASIPSNYMDVPAADAAGRESILLVLESPHKDEYLRVNGLLIPRAPAQGRGIFGAGRGIHMYGHYVLSRLNLLDGAYPLIIANPVPYQCSLVSVPPGKPRALDEKVKPVRDHVWRQLFGLTPVRQDFLARCKSYSPRVVLNCCTKELRAELTDFLCNELSSNFAQHPMLFECEHPSVQWCTQHKKGIPLFNVLCQGRTRIPC